jgi:signal transduction histidine kinase
LLNLTPTTALTVAKNAEAVNQPGLTALSLQILERTMAWSDQARAHKYETDFKLIEQERRRVAKELHDEVLPHLSRLVRTLQSKEKGLEKDTETKHIVSALHDLNETLRDLLAELHPVDLEELGLSSAVQNLCQRYSRYYRTTINCREENETCSLSSLQQLALYRALQLVLKYFAEDDRGKSNLLVRYQGTNGTIRLGLGVESKDYSVAKRLLHSMPEPELDAFFTWCSLAGAELQFTTWSKQEASRFLVLSAHKFKSATPNATIEHIERSSQIDNLSRIRLQELEQIMATAQSEWIDLLEKNSNFWEPMTIALERKRLLSEIERAVSPGFRKVELLTENLSNSTRSKAAKASLDTAMQLVDAVVSETYPRQLDNLNLISMIKLLINKFHRSTLIKPNLIAGKSTANIKLDTNMKLVVHRIVQEALNNIEKHAEAKNITVLLEPEREHLVICIEDDGVGFNEEKNHTHRGLKNIKERAKAMAGTATWQKSISYQSGTLLTIKLPNL